MPQFDVFVKFTVVKVVQSLKAFALIAVTVVGIVISVHPVVSPNADVVPLPILSTVYFIPSTVILSLPGNDNLVLVLDSALLLTLILCATPVVAFMSSASNSYVILLTVTSFVGVSAYDLKNSLLTIVIIVIINSIARIYPVIFKYFFMYFSSQNFKILILL